MKIVLGMRYCFSSSKLGSVPYYHLDFKTPPHPLKDIVLVCPIKETKEHGNLYQINVVTVDGNLHAGYMYGDAIIKLLGQMPKP